MKKTLLIIKTEKTDFSQLTAFLTENNFTVNTCFYSDLISSCTDIQPDAIITESIEVTENIRSWSDVPVIVISRDMSENHIISAFDAGADEYIHDSASKNILLARIRNALCHKRIPADTANNYSYNGLEIDFDKRNVCADGKEVRLTPIEYSIVELLCRNRGSVVTYEYILKKIWGPYISSDNKILRVNMTNIRKKLEADPSNPKYIKTENGIGYSIA